MPRFEIGDKVSMPSEDIVEAEVIDVKKDGCGYGCDWVMIGNIVKKCSGTVSCTDTLLKPINSLKDE